MTGIEYDSLADLNMQAYKWCEKVNNKVHGTTNELPKHRLLRERLSPLLREYMTGRTKVRKVGKDCLMSYGGSFCSIPSKHVVLVVSDNTLAAYYEGKKVALHMMNEQKKSMNVSKHHYQKLLRRQSFDTENTLMHGQAVDFEPFAIDLEAYDV